MAQDNTINKTDVFNIFTGLPAFANAKNNFDSTDMSRVGAVYGTDIPALVQADWASDAHKFDAVALTDYLQLMTNTYSQLRYYTICLSGGGCYNRTGYRAGFSGNTVLSVGETAPFAQGQTNQFSKYSAVLPQIQARINANVAIGGGTLTYCHSSCHSSCHCSRGRR